MSKLSYYSYYIFYFDFKGEIQHYYFIPVSKGNRGNKKYIKSTFLMIACVDLGIVLVYIE
jgi:hypothetical protein